MSVILIAKEPQPSILDIKVKHNRLYIFVIVLSRIRAESAQLFFVLAGAEVDQAGKSNYLRRGQLYLLLCVTLQDIRWRLQYSTVTFIFVEEDLCFIKVVAVDELIDVSLR
jgi:hypothetical protein